MTNKERSGTSFEEFKAPKQQTRNYPTAVINWYKYNQVTYQGGCICPPKCYYCNQKVQKGDKYIAARGYEAHVSCIKEHETLLSVSL